MPNSSYTSSSKYSYHDTHYIFGGTPPEEPIRRKKDAEVNPPAVTPSGISPFSGLPFSQQTGNDFSFATNLNQFEPDHFSTTRNKPFRPILIGLLIFLFFNILISIGITFSPLNSRFNFKYGNFLPAKLAMLQQNNPQKMDVLFLGTSQTNNGFIPSVFEQSMDQNIRQSHRFMNQPRPINSFNLGLPNNRYDIMLAYLQYHQQRYGKPKMVFIELSPSIQEKNATIYYLPALYYRTLIEKRPTLLPLYLSNPLLANNVRQEIFLSFLSSLHQYRFTFSPVNLFNKISHKLAGISQKLASISQTIEQKIAQKIHIPGIHFPQENISHTAESTITQKTNSQKGYPNLSIHYPGQYKVPSPPRGKGGLGAPNATSATPAIQNPAMAAGDDSADDDGTDASLAQYHITSQMTAKGWYPKPQSPHMTSPQGIVRSVAVARQYYIDSQKQVDFDKLHALLAYCRKSNIRVVLVTWPNHPLFLKTFQASRLNATYQKGLHQLLAEEPTIWINLNQDLPANQKDIRPAHLKAGFFADPRHLTPDGARFFSRQLALRCEKSYPSF